MSLNPEIVAELAAHPLSPPPPPPEGVPPHIHDRELLDIALSPIKRYFTERLPDKSTYRAFDTHIPVENGEILVRVVQPTTVETDSFPALVWYHGGGWVKGNIYTDEPFLTTVSVELGLVIVLPDYRLAPEHPFPTGFNDNLTALKWVVQHASELKVDPKKGLLVGGDSAGANFAAAVALAARDDPFFSANPVTGQYLREPPVCHPDAYPAKYKAELRSFDEGRERLVLNSEILEKYFKLYKAPPTDLRFSPLLAPSHAGLAPAFIQVQGLDPLRDEGILYEKLLREAGVPTRIIQYEGTPHAFNYLWPSLPTAQKLDQDARDGLRWLLSLAKGT